MRNIIRTWHHAAVCLAVTLLMSLAMVSAVGAEERSLMLNKAIFIKATGGTSFSDRGAELCAGFKKKDKLKAKGMKFSADVYVPVKALQEAGDLFTVGGYLYLQKTNVGNKSKKDGPRENWKGLLGLLESKYDFFVTLKKNGKLQLRKRNLDTDKVSKAGKYIRVERKGDYYLVHLKNVPFTGKYYKLIPKARQYEYLPMVTNKKYFLSPSVIFTSVAKTDWGGNIYVDNLKVTSGTRTQKITFDKKDYRDLYVSNWRNSNGQVPQIIEPMR